MGVEPVKIGLDFVDFLLGAEARTGHLGTRYDRSGMAMQPEGAGSQVSPEVLQASA